MKPVQNIANALGVKFEPNRLSGTTFTCRCPAHEDNKPSLSVTEKEDGAVLVYCHAGCSTESILESRGLTFQDLYPKTNQTSDWVATYDYTDEAGQLVYQVIRKANKQFLQRRPDPHSPTEWMWKMGDQARYMYRLPLLRKAAQKGESVFIVEGEKDVHSLEQLGLVATTNSGGAKKFKKYAADLLPQFEGIDKVYILPDNDIPGQQHTDEIAGLLTDIVPVVKVIQLPRLRDKEDITDWLNLRSGTLNELQKLCDSALEWMMSEEADPIAEDTPKTKQRTQAQILLELAKELPLFSTPDQDCYVSLPIKGHTETHRLKSKAVRYWLLHRFYQQMGKPPSAQALQDALGSLEAKALFDNEVEEVFLRLARQKDTIYIDLGDETWDVVKITSEGWELVSNPPVHFHRPSSLAPICRPALNGDLSILKKHTGFDDTNHALLCGFLVQALNPEGPYPVLNLTGEQGTAKSTRTKQIRAIVDPSAIPVRSQPRSEQDLLIAALNNRVIALDNLSKIPPWLSDALCRISTGGGYGTRTLYENTEETVFTTMRPIVLNGIEDFATRPDLLDRSISLQLPVIAKKDRKTEREVWNLFYNDLPIIMAGLFDAVSKALARVNDIQLNDLPRMADFAQWAVAAEPAFGVPEGTFIRAYSGNRDEAIENAIEADVVATAIQTMLEVEPTHRIETTAGELIEKLKQYLPNPERPPRNYPTTPQAMSGRLRRLMPALRAAGIERHDVPRTDSKRSFVLEWHGKNLSAMSFSKREADEITDTADIHDKGLRAYSELPWITNGEVI